MAIVYLATNLANGKRYIGVTRHPIETRRRGHFDSARNGARHVFARAIRKHGESVFSWRVLHDYLFTADAIEAEIRHILELKPEYNMSLGKGRAGLRHSEESKKKMGDSHRGKPNLKARGRKRSPDAVKKFQANGLAYRDEWIRRRHLGPAASARKVRCIDDGNIFDSASSAARHYNVTKSSLIELCLGKKMRKTVGGLRFEYVREA